MKDLLGHEVKEDKIRFVPLKVRFRPGMEPRVDCVYEGVRGTRISTCKKCPRYVKIALGGVYCRSGISKEVRDE